MNLHHAHRRLLNEIGLTFMNKVHFLILELSFEIVYQININSETFWLPGIIRTQNDSARGMDADYFEHSARILYVYYNICNSLLMHTLCFSEELLLFFSLATCMYVYIYCVILFCIT